eukprot:1781790-Amphidinium_carterae.2
MISEPPTMICDVPVTLSYHIHASGEVEMGMRVISLVGSLVTSLCAAVEPCTTSAMALNTASGTRVVTHATSLLTKSWLVVVKDVNPRFQQAL